MIETMHPVNGPCMKDSRPEFTARMKRLKDVMVYLVKIEGYI